MSLPGKNAEVLIEHLAAGRDAHGAKTTGAADSTVGPLDASIQRNSRDNLWKIIVAGDHSHVAKTPGEYRITASTGDTFAPFKVTHRAPIERLGESEHTLIFAELHGEIDRSEVT